jgi:hypothetical protein
MHHGPWLTISVCYSEPWSIGPWQLRKLNVNTLSIEFSDCSTAKSFMQRSHRTLLPDLCQIHTMIARPCVPFCDCHKTCEPCVMTPFFPNYAGEKREISWFPSVANCLLCANQMAPWNFSGFWSEYRLIRALSIFRDETGFHLPDKAQLQYIWVDY